MQNRIVEKDASGVEISPMKITGETEKRGTEVHFLPDTEIFKENNDFHYEILSKRLRELSFLNNGVRIRLCDERTGKEDDFAGAGGVKGFVDFINKGKQILHPNAFNAAMYTDLWLIHREPGADAKAKEFLEKAKKADSQGEDRYGTEALHLIAAGNAKGAEDFVEELRKKGGSGARIMTTLLYHMRDKGIKYGLQTMCEGGGQANATILELL